MQSDAKQMPSRHDFTDLSDSCWRRRSLNFHASQPRQLSSQNRLWLSDLVIAVDENQQVLRLASVLQLPLHAPSAGHIFTGLESLRAA